MNTYQVTERDQKRAESIRRQYIPREGNKMEQLQKLDNKVKLPGKIAGGILGIIGALVMGADGLGEYDHGPCSQYPGIGRFFAGISRALSDYQQS